ncbi:MFS domain-containing histidine kinase [Metabacillus idriensis]|uniref:histidine kinase n=1 Tax=Metabacillus idriensis TaxID=324768 RepID=A0A6I2M7B9_9BACI|nr:MFS domain-containing histidine kinase [Metabacillus idriensis]MCM3597307.1 MFS domain-containing histidine kinase [Metabacillus idriensis]MRX54060.1 GHKL domain-containing protein [Metabacillus idriensis]OHR73239.1 histidine kinase [Bacillus sp. HMSC76G11]
MGTKWKNSLTFFLIMMLLTYGISGLFSGAANGDRYLFKNYFQSNEFQERINYFTNLLSLYELNGTTKEEAKENITVSAEEIEEHRYRYGSLSDQIMNIESQYEEEIFAAKENGNSEVEKVLTEEKNKKIADITMNFKDDEHVRKKLIAEKEKNIDQFFEEIYKYPKSEYEANKNQFVYYLKSTGSEEVHTNLQLSENDDPKEFINQKDMYYIENYSGSRGYINSTDGFHYFGSSDITEDLIRGEETRFTGQIALSKNAPADSETMIEFRDFQKSQALYYGHSLSGLAALFISVFLLRRRPLFEPILKSKWAQVYLRLPLDVRILFTGIAFVGSMICMFGVIDYYPFRYGYEWLYAFIFLMIGTLFIAALIVQAVLLIRLFKTEGHFKAEWKTTVLYRIANAVSDAFLIQKVGIQLLILLGIVFCFGVGAAVVIVEPAFLLIYFPAFLLIGLPVVLFMFKRIGYFNKIVANSNDIMLGNLETDLPVNGKTALATLASNMNALKHGVKTSQQKQVKSERLKTELITNVSHDLRTPLTSIISYTELLKNPNLSEEERASYVEIVDRKSQRLKILIDDLFEASKMASGNIDLVKQNADIAQLLQQALAEYNEAISKSSLQFRVTHSDEPVYAVVDGQKMWRVFENLIGNILKYSLENTRVYLSVKKIGEQVIISFKNVTKYELSENTDELFERFKRGDSSRHTEGSGLGLTIAKSIVELHGGQLEIDVDGDLFKVTIILDAN